MLPHSLLCLLLILTSSSAALILPPPRIPRPPTPVEPIAPAPRPVEPGPNDRPNARPDPEAPEIPDVLDNNSQGSNTSSGVFIPFPTTTLSPEQAWRSLADSVPTATSTTGSGSSNTSRASKTAKQSASPTSGVTAPMKGSAVQIEAMGLRLWGSVVGLSIASIMAVVL